MTKTQKAFFTTSVKGGLHNHGPTRGWETLVYIYLTQYYKEQMLNKIREMVYYPEKPHVQNLTLIWTFNYTVLTHFSMTLLKPIYVKNFNEFGLTIYIHIYTYTHTYIYIYILTYIQVWKMVCHWHNNYCYLNLVCWGFPFEHWNYIIIQHKILLQLKVITPLPCRL